MPLEHREKCHSYARGGYEYYEMEISELSLLLEAYMERFFLLDDRRDEDVDFSSLIDKYLYLKYYHTIHNQSPSTTTKNLVLDPLKYLIFNDDDKDIQFNWTSIDLLMNLVVDFEFILQIKLNSHKIRRDLIHDYTSIFIERIIARYGIEVIKDSHFLIDYRDSLVFDSSQTIEELISQILGEVNITYYIEP